MNYFENMCSDSISCIYKNLSLIICNIYKAANIDFNHYLVINSMSQNISMPSMLPSMLPDLQLNYASDEDDEDADDEKQLMAMLIKLKTAKTAMEESRKRYRETLFTISQLFDFYDRMSVIIYYFTNLWQQARQDCL